MSKSIWHRCIAYLYRRLSQGNFGTAQWKKQFSYFGEGAYIGWPARITFGGGISLGDSSTISAECRIGNFTEEAKVVIGKGCWFGYRLSILNASSITIGNKVLMASDVLISSENHGMNPESELSYAVQPLVSKPVVIEDGCWIGEKVCILPGVTIGEKTIIGAGSVVTKSIPAYCIAVGNPAKVIKKYNFDTHNWETI